MDSLIEMLQSTSADDQITALNTLRSAKRTDAVTPVLSLLSSPDWRVRSKSADYLGQCAPIGDEETGRRLLAALNDQQELVRSDIATALRLLRYRPATADMRRLARSDPEWFVRVSAIEYLEERGIDESGESDATFATLVSALESDPSPVVQRSAANAIRVTAQAKDLGAITRLAQTQRSEPVNAIHLLLAAYKLGKPEMFTDIRQLLDAQTDSDDAQYIIGILKRAYTERLPAYVIADIPSLTATLDALVKRVPDASDYWVELQAQLTEIQQGKVIPASSRQRG
jgi:HEAT repeat protein